MENHRLIQVVAIYEVDPIYLKNEEEPLKFRIEILSDRSSESFFARLYRWETFRLQPTFLDVDKESSSINNFADHEILVRDPVIDEEDFIGKSMEEVISESIKYLEKLLGKKL